MVGGEAGGGNMLKRRCSDVCMEIINRNQIRNDEIETNNRNHKIEITR